MAGDDDIDFDAYMRDRGVKRGAQEAAADASGSEGASAEEVAGLRRALKGARILREQAREALAAEQAEHAKTRAALQATMIERDETGEALGSTRAERDQAREALASMQAERDALAKEHRALQRSAARGGDAAERAAKPRAAVGPSLREGLAERGIDDETEAAELLLALLERDPTSLLDGLRVVPGLAARGLERLALVCERPECQPEAEKAVVVRVAAERCEVCGGSDIKVAFDLLLRASRLAGVTRLVIVGGSPAYHTQLRELSRGTDLKLDLVSGRSKPGKRRARNDVERVVIWGSTILDHGTSAAYEHLGDRLIRVPHRGISRMLREVAQALA
ncbi:hypothetical protein [Paraliomyxa miuraensis]|uniref:hypothetical protein n=1 Tax=Paraliomyxa miuraensis TaxID=376150 RepID=UPI00224F6C69|nr:hypothetical protein [Paraliomyxa miuraensis]MCX4240646.1 hypothetical protein [Paraliomyxa miuraensis]